MAFDRTYEGLKLGPAQISVSPIVYAFDRTYEGLKLDLVDLLGGGDGLLTVPIRV